MYRDLTGTGPTKTSGYFGIEDCSMPFLIEPNSLQPHLLMSNKLYIHRLGLGMLAFKHSAKVFKIFWYMCHYGSGSPKRHLGLTNNPYADALNMGRLKKKDREACTVKTVIKYRSKSGRVSYKGSPALKSTQFLVIFAQGIHIIHVRTPRDRIFRFQVCWI